MSIDGGVGALQEIGYFRVTDRGLDQYEKYCHIDSKTIPHGGVVVDVGSGWNQELSRDLEKKDAGIKTISLDASLAIPVKGAEGITYQTWDNDKLVHVDEATAKKRLLEKRDGSVAAIIPDIPLKSNVADLVVDCYGPGTYLEDDKFVEYIGEVVRVLKNGGSAHIYPIDNFVEFSFGGDSYQAVKSADRRMAGVKFKDENISCEQYVQEDFKGDQRVGLVIKRAVRLGGL